MPVLVWIFVGLLGFGSIVSSRHPNQARAVWHAATDHARYARSGVFHPTFDSEFKDVVWMSPPVQEAKRIRVEADSDTPSVWK